MSIIKVMMYPHPEAALNGESGIHTILRKYIQHFPTADIEFVHPKADSFDVLAVHAGTANEFGDGPMVAHLHGLYWTADYDCALWEYKANESVISNMLSANCVTVPSEWVAQNIRRATRINPYVLPHGIDWQEWKTDISSSGYVLWNKNRAADVCDPTPVKKLAERFPGVNFVSTFAPEGSPSNVKTTGLIPHEEMKAVVKSAGVYLSTPKETFGIGMLEALASGVPVLAFREGGALQLVDHCGTGYLAKPGDMDDLARGLEYCIKHRDILSRNAMMSVRQFGWEQVAQKARVVYRDAIRFHNQEHDVTVVIPSYNKGKTVERAVISALNQEFPPSEIIVVNNNSTDDTDFDRIENLHEIVMVVNEPKQGVAHARNLGINLARTRYVCCLDGDDEIEDEFLRVCVGALKNDRSLGLAYTKLKAMFPDGREIVSEWPGEYNFDQFLVRKNQVPTCCVFRKDLADRLGGFRQRYAPRGAGSEDAEFWMRMGAMGYPGKLVTSDALFLYHTGGATSQEGYSEADWHVWHPWTRDRNHPFASAATPAHHSHPVKQLDRPKISVVIPVAENHGDLVIDALDSIEAQEMRHWEAIVAWDQESDVPESLKVAYPFVKFIHTRGKGAGYARNRGAELASARLLLFLDADDLLLPDALGEMLRAYFQSGNIVYSDYLGRAFIEDLHEVAKLRMMGRINSYNEETNEAVIHYSSFDYDCEKAQNQPRIENDGQFYIWCLICSLVPKEYHDAIDGFDEKMPSWEDWDYWLRMARAGKCFTRITKPLAQYRFYTGERRILANPSESGDSGRQLSSSLLKYLRDRYKEIEAMPCSGCGKSRSVAASQPARVSSPMVGTPENLNSSDVVMVRLMDGNTGSHQIAVQGQSYQTRKHGDEFLVLRKHADADPRLVIIGQDDPVVDEPQAEVLEPKVYEETLSQEQVTQVYQEAIIDGQVTLVADDGWTQKPTVKEDSSLPDPVPVDDLTEIYGINDGNVARLQESGVRTFSGLTTLPEERIKSTLGVTSRTAKRILREAKEKI